MIRRRPKRPRRWSMLALASLGILAASNSGCTRARYHALADRDVYSIERERQTDPRWELPPRLVEADVLSRMHDANDPDKTPIPPDEPAARPFQVSGRYPFEFAGWKKRGTTVIEDLTWRKALPTEKDGSVKLSRQSSVELALLHSRDYQLAFEDLYLASLSLTLGRFFFAVQGFSNYDLFFQHFGAKSNDSNQLQIASDSGFTQNLVTGGQLLVDFANNMVFEYHGNGFSTSLSSLHLAFTQPLLRNAFARIATQSLSLQERGVLYALRDFARFRRSFYVNTVASGGYLGLLLQLQALRNQESNLRQLQRNVEEARALVDATFYAPLQRDQLEQQFQQARFQLISAEASLQTQLDSFKIQLGLPPDLPVSLDDSPLDLFEFSDPALEDLRGINDQLALDIYGARETLAPEKREEGAAAPAEKSFTPQKRDAFIKRLQTQYGKLQAILDGAIDESRAFFDEQSKAPLGPYHERAGQLNKALIAARGELLNDLDDLNEIPKDATPEAFAKAYETIDRLARNAFRVRSSETFVAQTQVRVYRIQLTEVKLGLDEAMEYALTNRQDLMNNQARVTDAWRNVEFNANQLLAGLDLAYDGRIGTDPNFDNPFRFDASNSTQRFGIHLETPINRRAQRNDYRSSQIFYQRARRAYMLNHDAIIQQVRLDLRNLDLARRQFEIAREQLVIASRQVEEAEYNVSNPPANAESVALNLLNSLNGLLNSRNSLISSWVSYETARMSLFRDLDVMMIDRRGVWINEYSGTDGFPRLPRGAEGSGVAVDPVRDARPPDIDIPDDSL